MRKGVLGYMFALASPLSTSYDHHESLTLLISSKGMKLLKAIGTMENCSPIRYAGADLQVQTFGPKRYLTIGRVLDLDPGLQGHVLLPRVVTVTDSDTCHEVIGGGLFRAR